MNARHSRHIGPFISVVTRVVALCGAFLACSADDSRAALIFTETFQYTIGSNLAGQNGGTGFSGAWSGGNSTIVAGLTSGSGSAVQIGSSIAERPMSTTVSTSSGTTYITYLMNVSSFTGGFYTGISLWDGPTENMFIGIPYNAQKFGFDAHGGNGIADIKTVNFTPLTNTSYLIALGLIPSSTPGKVDVNMWATSNLGIDPNTLVAGTPNASLIGSRNNFSFSTMKLAGDYAGSLKVAGIGSSPNISEAAAVSVNAVPEPSTMGLAFVAFTAAAACGLRRRV